MHDLVFVELVGSRMRRMSGQRAKGKSEGKGVGPGFKFEGYVLGCRALSAVVYQTP